jgi:hypothetical protein
MKANKLTSVGALHPILFFAVMYVVVLFLSIFICSSLFYSFNSDGMEENMTKTTEPAKQQTTFPVQVSTAAVVR